MPKQWKSSSTDVRGEKISLSMNVGWCEWLGDGDSKYYNNQSEQMADIPSNVRDFFVLRIIKTLA